LHWRVDDKIRDRQLFKPITHESRYFALLCGEGEAEEDSWEWWKERRVSVGDAFPPTDHCGNHVSFFGCVLDVTIIVDELFETVSAADHSLSPLSGDTD